MFAVCFRREGGGMHGPHPTLRWLRRARHQAFVFVAVSCSESSCTVHGLIFVALAPVKAKVRGVHVMADSG
jgi:hypothetical protein